MEPGSLTDLELLALIVGKKTAAKIYHGQLFPLAFGNNSLDAHPRLKACMEFIKGTSGNSQIPLYCPHVSTERES